MLNGFKTYIAAIGLIGLGLWQLSQGQVEAGFASILSGLAMLGLRQAVGRIGG
jgi:hypothetical protein